MANKYIDDFLSTLKNRYNLDSKSMSWGDWICANTRMKGRPFTFDRYPFQKQIADDPHPNLDCIKPSQVGLSEVQIRKSLCFLARNRGTTLIFTLPNEKMFKRMSQTRIMPLVEEEKAFNLDGYDKPTRSMGLMQVNDSYLYVTGSTEGDATSISADAVMNDEVDLTDQSMLALFNSRLQNSDHKINQRFSTPTFHNYGVDQGYQASDQHEYMIKCQCCNHWQVPVFTRDFVHIPGLPDEVEFLHQIDDKIIDDYGLDLINASVNCEKCHMPLDLSASEYREWVPKFPSRTHARGYRVRPFSTHRLSVEYIVSQLLRYKRKDFLRGWYNTVLGEPYTDGNARLSDVDIEACFTGQAMPTSGNGWEPAYIGLDMGQTCHLTVGIGTDINNITVVLFEAVPVDRLIQRIEDVLHTYNIVGGMVDRHPYTPTSKALFALSGGRILPAEYRGSKEINIIEEADGEHRYCQVNRTMLIDEVARVVRNHRIQFGGYGMQKGIIAEHLKDMVRDEQPEKEAQWVKLTGNDHYFHSLGFMLSAVKLSVGRYGSNAEHRQMVGLVAADIGGAKEINIYGSKTFNKGGLIYGG